MQDLLDYLSQRIKQSSNLVQRQQYRRDLVKALINSYPAGTQIRPREMSKVLGFSPKASAVFTLLNTMLKNGEISRRPSLGSRGYSYTVLKPGNTYDEERQDMALKHEGYVYPAQVRAQRERRAREAEEFTDKPEETDTSEEVQTWTVKKLEEIARTRQFYHKGEPEYVADFLKALWAKEI